MICQSVEIEVTRPVRMQAPQPIEILAKGECIGDGHVILGRLGNGTMGHVYEAYDTWNDRHVAVKVSEPDVPSRHLREEARVLATLQHPSVVSMLATGTHLGIPYIVLERLHGQTLAEYLRFFDGQRAGTVAEILDILIAIADALHYIHSCGVVHRDLKPANVMLTDSGRVVLMDFGLQANTAEDRTRVRGTPRYLAPEAVTDPANCRTPALDIYSLGIIAYQMLTGRTPFNGRHPVEILRNQVRQPVPTMDQNPEISKPLYFLLAAMLAKKPGERLSDAGQVTRWLRHHRKLLGPANDNSKPGLPCAVSPRAVANVA